MQSLMGGTPFGGAASLSSPVETKPVAHGGDPHRSALAPQDRLGALDLGENSPRVEPLHRFIFGLPFELHTETTEFL
ncbi:MAG: hypothetical protein F6K53_35635 [Moorea sp. SIO4A1]|nr:hypothetical protein [Moorena sp. SIO4A1]